MIAFQHNLEFDSGPLGSTESVDPSLPRIRIIEATRPFEAHPAQASWYPMSGRQARFTTRDGSRDFRPDFEFGLEVEGVTELRWLRVSSEIQFTRGPEFTRELLQFWVLHTFLPAVLTLEDRMEVIMRPAWELADRP